MRKRERGQALIEFALVLGIFLLMVLGGADIIWFEIEKGSVNFLAQQAAICYASGTCDPTDYVQKAAAGFNLDPKKVSVSTPSATSVKVVYVAHPFTGFLRGVTLTTVATTPKLK